MRIDSTRRLALLEPASVTAPTARGFGASATLGIAAAALITVAVGIASIVEFRRTTAASEWARQSLVVWQQARKVGRTIVDAETGQRGYLLTADPAYLEPYEQAVRQVPRAVLRLRARTVDPVEAEMVDTVRPLIDAKVAEMARTVDMQRRGDVEGAREVVRSGAGKATMDEIRSILERLERHNAAVTRERLAARDRLGRRATALMVTGSFLVIALGGAAILLVRRNLERALRAEAEWRASEERLRVTLRSIGDAVIATDTTGRIVFMNAVAEALTGWAIDDARGRPLDEIFRIVNEYSGATVESPVVQVLRAGTVVGLANHTLLLARDGRAVPIDDSGAPIKDADGALMGVVLVFRDVSARRDADADRLRVAAADAARVEAERADHAKDAFLATLSHELRSPLSAMMAWLGILRRRGVDTPTVDRALDVLERNVRLQADLINDLLDVSRITSGKLDIQRAPVDLTSEIRAGVDGLLPSAEAKSIALVRDLPAEPIMVEGDAGRLAQVLRNLVDNALKFTSAGGTVGVHLRRDGATAELRVVDSGEGFAPELGAAIFERFRQATSERTRRHGGLGLGLAIVQHLVRAHGGTVDAASDGAGRGATFTVRLPIDDADRIPIAPRPSLDGNADLRGVHVLVVEDEPDWREAVALRFSQTGAEVTTAASVTEALDAFDRRPPDVLVSDLGMPERDGYELIREVRARPDAPRAAVAMTGFADAASRERCLALGFDACLAKPFEPGDLVATVASLLAPVSA